MNIVIPPIFFYVMGAILVVSGAVRAATLGRRDPERELLDDTPERAKARRRHLTFGIVWVAMGLFLIFSTAGLLHLRH
jgi:cytochrome c biogenesis protein CcdA